MINKIYFDLRLLLFNIVIPVIFFLLLATPAWRNLPRLFEYRLTKTLPSQKLRGGYRKNIIGTILFCFSRIDKKSSSLPHYSLLYYTKSANVFSSLKIVYAFRFSKYFIVYSTPVTLFRYLKFWKKRGAGEGKLLQKFSFPRDTTTIQKNYKNQLNSNIPVYSW